PRTGPNVTESAMLELLRSEVDRWQAQKATERFARPITPDMPPLLPTFDLLAPVARISDAAITTGFVNYLPNRDGVVRTMPLWISHGNNAYPQAGLSLACLMLGIQPNDPQRVRFERDAIVLLPPDHAPISIPVRALHSTRLGHVA